MMMRAIIIDDEHRAIRVLEIMLTKLMEDINLVATSTDAEQGVELINNYQPDIVFLDINMPGLDGFELLEKLQFRGFYLVFCTAHEEFAIRALKNNAYDYLLKPIDIKKVKETLSRIRTEKEEQKTKPDIITLLKDFTSSSHLRIPLISKDDIEYVLPEQIVYMEADSHNATVNLRNGTSKSVKTGLKYFETLLCKTGSQFMRIHHSFIINLEYVTTYLKADGGYVRMKEKKTIPVSKHKKKEFFSRINLTYEL